MVEKNLVRGLADENGMVTFTCRNCNWRVDMTSTIVIMLALGFAIGRLV